MRRRGRGTRDRRSGRRVVAAAGAIPDARGDSAPLDRARAAAAHRVLADRRVPATPCRLLRANGLAPARDEVGFDAVGVRAVLRLDSPCRRQDAAAGNEAWRIRALGPAFHALAEINVTGWTAWVAATGNSWYEAGVEARRRMAATGYDVTAGDGWALNELSSAVRQGTGNARANMRAFLNGLYDGDGDPAPHAGRCSSRGSARRRPTSRSTRRACRTGTRTQRSGVTRPIRQRLVAGGLRRRPAVRDCRIDPGGPARSAQ